MYVKKNEIESEYGFWNYKIICLGIVFKKIVSLLSQNEIINKMKRILFLCMTIIFITCHKSNDEAPQSNPNPPTNTYLYGITIDDS